MSAMITQYPQRCQRVEALPGERRPYAALGAKVQAGQLRHAAEHRPRPQAPQVQHPQRCRLQHLRTMQA